MKATETNPINSETIESQIPILYSNKPQTGMTDDAIDPKLNHLVRKYLSLNCNDEDRIANADQVADWLRKKYREYQRKDIARLRGQVQTIMTSIEESILEDEYDEEARAHDEQRSKIINSSGNGLNASLTKNYRKLQQERDAEEEANRALEAAEAGDLHEINEMNGTTESINETNNDTSLSSKKRVREDSVVSTTSVTKPALEKRSSKLISGGKSMKRKKSSGARRNSTKSGGHTDPGMPGKDSAATICEAVPRPTERYTDLGGMKDILTQIRQLVEYPLVRPELYRHLGVDPPRGVLLRGPPG
jgi:ATP-dependent 26S proteasome regulatory subunit